MNIIKYKTINIYITLAPSLTGLISHYTYGTLYNIYTITNNYNHTYKQTYNILHMYFCKHVQYEECTYVK